MKHTPCPAKLGCLFVCAMFLSAGCDDDPSSSSGRDTRLEWPVDSGGFSTPDGGAPETRSHDSDAHTHDGGDAHASDVAADGHTHDSADAHGPANGGHDGPSMADAPMRETGDADEGDSPGLDGGID
jgi:hypothetical protein